MMNIGEFMDFVNDEFNKEGYLNRPTYIMLPDGSRVPVGAVKWVYDREQEGEFVIFADAPSEPC